MKKLFCVTYKANFIKTLLENDPNIYGLIFSKSSTSNNIKIWELSPKFFTSFMEPIVVKDDTVKWAYVNENNPSIFEYPNDDNPPNDEYSLQFFDTIPDFVLFRRENLLAIMRKSDDNCLYISGARIDYGLGRNDFRNTSNNTTYPTLKAETKFTYKENDKDEVYWNVAIGVPCPTSWGGAVAEVIDKIKISESNESIPKNKYHLPKEMTVKDALNELVKKLRETS